MKEIIFNETKPKRLDLYINEKYPLIRPSVLNKFLRQNNLNKQKEKYLCLTICLVVVAVVMTITINAIAVADLIVSG